MKRFGPWDYLKLEMGTQWHRLAYADATSRGKSYCNFPPRKIAIEATSFCNLRCIHCVHGVGENGKERLTRTKSMLDIDLFKKVIDEAAEFRHSTKVVFALLGEPLLNRRLEEMVAYAHSRGIWTQVNTNCTLLTKKRGEDLIEAGLDFIYLSLDGITKETYERIRVQSDFDRVLNNILNFIELKFEREAWDLTIHVGMTGEIINRREIDVFVREFSRLPIDMVYSPLLFNWNGAIEWADEDLKKGQGRDQKSYPVCNSAYDICGIQSNGDFVPCIYDYDGKYVSGNVRDHTLMELWNNERTQNFRRAINARDYRPIEERGALCTECTLLWSPHYQIKPSLSENLSQVAQYTGKALKTFFTKPAKKARLYEKYCFLRDQREDFLRELSREAYGGESKWFEVVRTQGVLQVEL